jgi:hypothetical protein
MGGLQTLPAAIILLGDNIDISISLFIESSIIQLSKPEITPDSRC